MGGMVGDGNVGYDEGFMGIVSDIGYVFIYRRGRNYPTNAPVFAKSVPDVKDGGCGCRIDDGEGLKWESWHLWGRRETRGIKP
jgi:hypothetical protein